jgi:hypothetical protein
MLIFFFGTETKWALNNYVAFLNTFIYPLLKLVLIFGHLSYEDFTVFSLGWCKEGNYFCP